MLEVRVRGGLEWDDDEDDDDDDDEGDDTPDVLEDSPIYRLKR